MARAFGGAQRQPAPAAKKPEPTKTQPKAAPPAVVAQKVNLPTALLNKQLAAAKARAGFENIGSREMSIPFWKIVDKSSAVAIEGGDAYIEGCRPGMIYNSVTKQLVAGDEGILVLACGFKSVIIEYESDQPGSGFIAEHACDSGVKQGGELNEKGQYILPNGHCLVDSYNYSSLVSVDGTEFDAGMLAMSGSNMGVGRQWNTVMANRKVQLPNGERFTPATFGVLYRLRTKIMKRDQFVWYVWDFTDEGLVEDENLFQRAEDLNNMTLENRVQGNYGDSAQRQTEPGSHEDDDIPFDAP